MLPLYLLTVDITAKNITIDDEQFRELIAPCQSYLDSLQGICDRRQSTVVYYPPNAQHDSSEWWSARCVVATSLGKKRAEYLCQLFQAIVRLIALELPDLEVQASINGLQFS
jgi:hypothetical protein